MHGKQIPSIPFCQREMYTFGPAALNILDKSAPHILKRKIFRLILPSVSSTLFPVAFGLRGREPQTKESTSEWE
jgi:hypothetical protein